MKQKVQIDDFSRTQRMRQYLEAGIALLRIRPNSGKLWLDLIYLIVIAALHMSILPTITHSLIPFDLITPWLIVSFVTQPLPKAIVLGFVGALALETHSAAPAGFYMCCYWIILSVLTLVKSPLSWRHRFPWLVTFALAEIWIAAFESFVIALGTGLATFDWVFISEQLLRIALAIGFGLLLVRRWSNLDPSLFDEEEMPV